VLRRLIPRTEFAPCEGQEARIGILLDVETTGLNTAQDEIIELGMVKFDYLPGDRMARITDVFSSFNEPSNPIPAEIIELTGITDEMVSGHRIDPDAVASFVADAVLVVAHNANFDRPAKVALSSLNSKVRPALAANVPDACGLNQDNAIAAVVKMLDRFQVI
jgi:DNA polymerase III subunit epsilon